MKKNNHVALDALDLPYDLKKLDIDQCKQLCGEIRDILVETVSKNGGHLASGASPCHFYAFLYISISSA